MNYPTLTIVIYLEILAVANFHTGYKAEACVCVLIAALNLALTPNWALELVVPLLAILNDRRPWYLMLVMPLITICVARVFYSSRSASTRPGDESV